MRLSIPTCLCSSLAVVSIGWWLGTRGKDFMTPPPEARLQQIKRQVEQAIPPVNQSHNAVSMPVNGERSLMRTTQVPVVLPADLQAPPSLDDYSEEVVHGAAYLIDLAGLLESGAHLDRALLCWERVLDSSNADNHQTLKALSAIERLHRRVPPWNRDADQATPIVIHVGTGPAAAGKIRNDLKRLSGEIASFSSGILRCSINVATGSEDLSRGGATPVALWISGADANSPSTEIVSFTIAESSNVHLELYKAAYQAIRTHITRELKLSTPATLGSSQDALSTITRGLESGITKLAWQRFGESLNPAQ